MGEKIVYIGFQPKYLKGRGHSEDLGLDERIILKCKSRK
jgi:hypothetical protein